MNVKLKLAAYVVWIFSVPVQNFQMLEAPFQDGGDMKVGAHSEDAPRAVKAVLGELRVKLQELLKASVVGVLQACKSA